MCLASEVYQSNFSKGHNHKANNTRSIGRSFNWIKERKQTKQNWFTPIIFHQRKKYLCWAPLECWKVCEKGRKQFQCYHVIWISSNMCLKLVNGLTGCDWVASRVCDNVKVKNLTGISLAQRHWENWMAKRSRNRLFESYGHISRLLGRLWMPFWFAQPSEKFKTPADKSITRWPTFLWHFSGAIAIWRIRACALPTMENHQFNKTLLNND